MDRKNFISKLFMIGIAAVIPKVFMKPTIYKGAMFRSIDGRNYIRGECGGPELYIPQEGGKIIPNYPLIDHGEYYPIFKAEGLRFDKT